METELIGFETICDLRTLLQPEPYEGESFAKFNPNHDELGRFTFADGGGVNMDAYMSKHRTYGEDAKMMGKVIHSKGWSAPSRGVDSKTYQELAEDLDYITVFRGAPKGATQGLLDGKPFIGNGQAGPGTYVSAFRDRAEQFKPEGGELMEMLIPRSVLEKAQGRTEAFRYAISKYHYNSSDSDAPQVLSAYLGHEAHRCGDYTGRDNDYVIYNTSKLIVKVGK